MSIGMNAKKPESKKEASDIADNLDDLDDQESSSGILTDLLKNKFLLALIGGGVLLVVIIFVVFNKKYDTTQGTTPQTSAVTSEQNSGSSTGNDAGTVDSGASSDGFTVSGDGNVDSVDDSGEDATSNLGDNNYSASSKNKTTEKVYDANDFIKDLHGKDVQAVYSVKDRQYVTAHVAYTAKRAIIDDGMEMYWIDVEYKKKKYRVQVPFYYFKDFDDTGICRVEMEVLNLESGGQIISYMQVISEDDGTGSSSGE